LQNASSDRIWAEFSGKRNHAHEEGVAGRVRPLKEAFQFGSSLALFSISVSLRTAHKGELALDLYLYLALSASSPLIYFISSAALSFLHLKALE